MKGLAELTKPDPRNEVFVRPEASPPVSTPVTLDYYYEKAASIRLNEEVPEDVRDNVEIIKNLFVYGWFYYPFCTLAGYLSTFAVEMALRKRVGNTLRRGKPTLGNLFEEAIRRGLIPCEWASQIDRLEPWEFAWSVGRLMPLPLLPVGTTPATLTADAVRSQMARIRDPFAHPWYAPTSFADDALEIVAVSCEVINHLWPVGENP